MPDASHILSIQPDFDDIAKIVELTNYEAEYWNIYSSSTVGNNKVTKHDLSAVLRNKVVQVCLFLLNYKLSVESQFSKAS